MWSDNSFTSWIDKKNMNIENISFPEPYSHSKNKVKVKLELSYYATKFVIDISKFV